MNTQEMMAEYGAASMALDEIGQLRQQMKAYRAIEQLTTNEMKGSEESMGHVQRSDLSMLLCVVNVAIEAQADLAHEICKQAVQQHQSIKHGEAV